MTQLSPTIENFGPLARLAGVWEGDEGMDFSFHHAEGATGQTPYREKITLAPFGPVQNGRQTLHGLDYRMAAWRGDEESPFHTEVGYWLYDPATTELTRCFMIPRGQVLIASGNVAPDATSFDLKAEHGSTTNGILSNTYLEEHARAVSFEVHIDIHDDGRWSYSENSVLAMSNLDANLDHTDKNTLTRVEELLYS
jgi:hypothetical protein